MDIDQRQVIMDKLRNRVKKASSNVSTKVEANQGDFKVVLTEISIDHYYKDSQVGSIRVASLEPETIDLINNDPNEAAQDILETFAKNFDVTSYNKTSDKEDSSTKEASLNKEAAHETLDQHTWQMTTQKQLDEQKPSIHPRTDEYPKNVTQKQLPEEGQRPGTYDQITQAQLSEEKTTFYNKPLESGERRLEDRSVVTEGQFEEGIDKHTDEAASDRGQTGGKFDGELVKQQKMTGEKQLAELLKHHEWTEPLTITEGKDQFGGQDGELSRITAETAEKIIKESLNALGNTVLAAGVMPSRLAKIVNTLISHPSKYPVLANVISLFANHETKAIEEKVAKAKFFGKVANANQEWSDEMVADIFVRQLGKLSHSSKDVVDGLVALSQDDGFVSKIDDHMNNILQANNDSDTTKEANTNIFQQVLSGEANKPVVEGSADSDGLYEYAGTIEEVKTSTNNKDDFAKAAASHAKKVIKAQINNNSIELTPLTIDVNEDLGTFKIQLKDDSFKDESLEVRAEKRRNLVKEAQFGGGGGAPPSGGDQMGNPMAPAGEADMGAPPAGEAFSQEPPMDDIGMPEEEVGGEPKPPGAICPVDGSEDVDVDNGEFRCNSCGAEGTIHVRLDVNKWPETIQETDNEKEPGFGIGAEEDQDMEALGEEPMGAPGGEGEGTTMPNVPVAASVRLTPLLLNKIAEQKIDIGSVCPNCGGHNTDNYKSASTKGQHGICWDCLQEYNFQVKANKNKLHNVFAQFIWTPKVAENCNTCSRLRTAFLKSLNDYGMTVDQFDKLASIKAKAEVILKMAESNTLNIKESMNSPLSINKYAATFKQKFEKFPSASCRERIARRFGENATAMSGPCEGKALTDCVCGQLEDLGIYTDGLAAKVAHVQNSSDPMINSPSETCVKMFVMDNYSVKEACTICDGLRASAATDEELLIEAIAQISPMLDQKPMAAPNQGMKPTPTKPMAQAPKKPMEVAAPMAAPVIEEDNSCDSCDSCDEVLDLPVEDAGDGHLDIDLVSDEGDGADMDIEMEGDFGDDFEDDFEDEGLDIGDNDGDMVTILVNGLQSIIDALQGNLTDDMIDTTGEELGETIEDEIHEEPVEEGLDTESPTDEIVEDSLETPDEEIPGVLEDEEDFGKHGDEDAEPMMDKHMMEKQPMESRPMESKPMGKKPLEQVVAENNSDGLNKQAEVAELDQMLYKMKTGTINNSSSALDNLVNSLISNNDKLSGILKEAKADNEVKTVERETASESKIKDNPAQDSTEVKYTDGGKMGHEESFKADSPDVPRGDATIGDEGSEVKISDTDRPSVPHGSSLMDGEEHYKPEKGDEVDGNQGAQTTANDNKEVKTAQCKCKEDCKDCGGKDKCKGDCGCETKECSASAKYTLKAGDKYYDMLESRLASGKSFVKLADNNKYSMTMDNNKKIYLVAECDCGDTGDCDCGSGKCKEHCKACKKANSNIEIKKESQTVAPKSVDKLEDDPDLNPSSGPGAGKTHADQAHSLGVDEKKPSDGMSEPDVPADLNGGQLIREHTYDNKLDGPEVPAGGGSNTDYDQDEKNTPEKLDQTLGKENDIAAMASLTKDRATKIAGQLLKAQKITVDELPNKIAELSNTSTAILDDYEAMMKEALTKKGLQKAANGGLPETSFQLKTSSGEENNGQNLTESIQGLFRLDQRNKDFERQTGSGRLWR